MQTLHWRTTDFARTLLGSQSEGSSAAATWRDKRRPSAPFLDQAESSVEVE